MLFLFISVVGGGRQSNDGAEQQPLTGNGTDAGAGSSRNSLDFHKEDEVQETKDKENATAVASVTLVNSTHSEDKEKNSKSSSKPDKDDKASTATAEPGKVESTAAESTGSSAVPAQKEKPASDSTTSVTVDHTASVETTMGENVSVLLRRC